MSKELIEKLREASYSASHGEMADLLQETADALEAKAAPVGEPTSDMVMAAIQAFRMDISPTEAMYHALKAALQAGAAYQRAQQPQSAEAVATVTAKLDKVSLIDALVPVGTKLYTTPQPSAGVVMPERKTAADFGFYIDSFAAEAAEIHNRVIDEFARLNGKEVGRG